MIHCEFCNGDAMDDRETEPFFYNGMVCCWKCFIAFFELGFPEIKPL